MADTADRQTIREGRPGRLRQKLMQLSLTLTGIGVVLLVVSLIAMAWLRTHSDQLALERTPAMVATQRAQIGLQQSLAGLRGWVALGDERFRAIRRAAWEEQIEPAMQELWLHRESWQDPADRDRLEELARLLVELKESQWWVEDVARTEGNQPALLTFRQRVEPIALSMARTIDSLIAEASPESMGRLVDFRRVFSGADTAIARFVTEGEQQWSHAFLDSMGDAEEALADLAGRADSFSHDQAERFAYLQREFRPFSRFAEEAVTQRAAEDWNIALLRMRNETAVLTQQVVDLFDRLAASQTTLMGDETEAMTLAGDTAMAVSAALIMLMAGIAYALASYRATQITEPVTRLSDATEEFARGTLREDLPITTDDELAILTGSFNRMRAQLQAAEAALKTSNLQLHDANSELERRNDFIRNTFGRYLSDDVVTKLLDTPSGLELGGESRRVTILMSDLRGFTSLAARLAPQQVVAILNRYLGAMAEVISRYEGTIDEFIGDAILVIFGAPVRSEDHAARAVACSIAMQAAMDAVNGANRRDGLPEIEMGIGVHTGEVVVGNIGSEARAKYGVVGSPVNLTSRIESYTVGGQILASEATRREVGGIMQVGARLEIEAKGVDEPAVVHTVRGIGGGFDLQLAEEDEETVELGEPVPLRFTTLEGKYLGGEWTPGRLVRLAARSGEVACEGPVAPFTNLKIVLDAGTRAPFPREFYAKCVGSGSQRIDIHITSIPPELAAWLEHRRATSARG